MLQWVFRVFFVLVIIAAAFGYVSSPTTSGSDPGREAAPTVAVVGILMAVFVFLLDCLTPKSKLGALAGVFFLVVDLEDSAALLDASFSMWPLCVCCCQLQIVRII